jgi:hypothetical protein
VGKSPSGAAVGVAEEEPLGRTGNRSVQKPLSTSRAEKLVYLRRWRNLSLVPISNSFCSFRATQFDLFA